MMESRSQYSIFNLPLSLITLMILQIVLLIILPCDSFSPRTPSLVPTMDLRSKGKQVQRGLFGRLLAFRTQNSNAAYMQTLKDQISQMERQLRQSEMEALQLRTLLRCQSSSNRRSTSDTIREQSKIEDNMKDIISQLSKQIEDLKNTKVELEQMLKLEQERAATAEDLLKQEQTNSQKLVQNSRIQMEEMKESIMKKATFQMEEMEKSHLSRFQKELQQVKIESEKVLEQERARSSVALKKERKELEEEKRKGKEAVEKERVKMRKLVKALAEKEKKDLARAGKRIITNEDQSKRKENRRLGSISTSGSLSTIGARKAQVRGKTKNS